MTTLYDYAGIDYGNGKTNIDTETGIRYGVIPFYDISQAWCESSEAHYRELACPDCGSEVVEYEVNPHVKKNDIYFACESCKILWIYDDCDADEPDYFEYTGEGYQLRQTPESADVWVFKSPFFTYAQFCSPCAPGACYLRNPVASENSGNKCYCLGHDWFDDGEALYPVYSVESGELVEPVEG